MVWCGVLRSFQAVSLLTWDCFGSRIFKKFIFRWWKLKSAIESIIDQVKIYHYMSKSDYLEKRVIRSTKSSPLSAFNIGKLLRAFVYHLRIIYRYTGLSEQSIYLTGSSIDLGFSDSAIPLRRSEGVSCESYFYFSNCSNAGFMQPIQSVRRKRII